MDSIDESIARGVTRDSLLIIHLSFILRCKSPICCGWSNVFNFLKPIRLLNHNLTLEFKCINSLIH